MKDFIGKLRKKPKGSETGVKSISVRQSSTRPFSVTVTVDKRSGMAYESY